MEGVTPLLIGPMQTNTPTDIRLHRHHPQYILGPEYVPRNLFQRFGDSPKGNSCTKSRRYRVIPNAKTFSNKNKNIKNKSINQMEGVTPVSQWIYSLGPCRRTLNDHPLIFDCIDIIRNTYSVQNMSLRSHFKDLAILQRVIAVPNREGSPPPCLSFGPVRRTHNLRPLIFDVTDFIRNTYSAIYFKSRNHFKSLAILRRVNIAEPNREGTVESRTQRLCLIKK